MGWAEPIHSIRETVFRFSIIIDEALIICLHSSSSAPMNNHRRVFRGRGGPTDRRLPKHNARRVKKSTVRDDLPKENKYGDAKPTEIPIPLEDVDVTTRDFSEEELGIPTDDEQKDEKVIASDNCQCLKEIKHLQKRIKNLRESFQLSMAITEPKIYQENALNASANCINEWRQILTFYANDDDLTTEIQKENSLLVFQLIQHSLQCGPLAGSKAGYFKRCGSDVAKIVLNYLLIIVPDTESSERLGFTPNQTSILEKWKKNAQKAVESDKPPSKSQLKKQTRQQNNNANKRK